MIYFLTGLIYQIRGKNAPPPSRGRTEVLTDCQEGVNSQLWMTAVLEDGAPDPYRDMKSVNVDASALAGIAPLGSETASEPAALHKSPTGRPQYSSKLSE